MKDMALVLELTPLVPSYSQDWKLKYYYPPDTKRLPKRRKNILFLVSKTSQIGLKWKSRRPFFITSSRRLPVNVLKTSFRRRPQDVYQDTSLKTFSRKLPQDLFQETSLRRLRLHQHFFWWKQRTIWRPFIDFLSTYVLNYLHINTPSFDRQTN